jgi:hypothetical protein
MYIISTVQETTPPVGTMAVEERAADTKSEGSFDSMGEEGTMVVEEGGAADNQEETGESAPPQKYGSLHLPLEDNEENDVNDGCCLRMFKGKWCSCCGKCIARWPRTFAILFGVIFPLWLLIALSLFFGYFLAELEAPNEIIENNNILAAQAQVRLLGSLAARAAQVIPTICFELFLLGLPVANLGSAVESALDDPFQAGTTQPNPPVGAILSDDLIVVNKTAMYEFMEVCGEEAGPITEALLRRASDVLEISTTELTFNWIRCGPWANGLGSTGVLARLPVVELRPEAQQEFYNQTWYDDQQQLFEKYLEEYVEANETINGEYFGANLTLLAARFQVFQDSIGNATGGSKCFLNVPASGEFCFVAVLYLPISMIHLSLTLARAHYLTVPAWFWFTVMTTIGYGNQAPETMGGRALIYSLGFLSILAFAGILAAAGNIASHIFDDAVNRIKVHSLTTPWVACVVWGAVYYSWMGIIAAQTKRWKEKELGVGK